ncbi:MAG: small ribosomal subunit Rsm22 family protein [Polyangiaceae bacterium]
MAHRGRVLIDEQWRSALDAVADLRRWPKTHEHAKIAAHVSRVSAAYNHEGHDAVANLDRQAALAARSEFFFPRDIAKGWGAARELVRTGAIGDATKPLRIMDIGAGVGAMTWGIAHALADNPERTRSIEAVLVDGDADALKVAEQIADQRKDVNGVSVKIETMRQISPFSASLVGGPFDLVIAGQLLSELDRDVDPEERVVRHVRLIRSWLDAAGPNGSLILVEPALRDRTRHLHRIRDVIAKENLATIFAPCLHAESCPMLARDDDWCSEDLPIDLPEWLAAIARGAGLRWQGSTFSYLVLRKDALSLAAFSKSHPARFRVVSDRIETKGKTEFYLCGTTKHDDAPRAGSPSVQNRTGKIRVTRLDRHETPENKAWDAIGRGAVISIDPPPALRGANETEARIDSASRVASLDFHDDATSKRGE